LEGYDPIPEPSKEDSETPKPSKEGYDPIPEPAKEDSDTPKPSKEGYDPIPEPATAGLVQPLIFEEEEDEDETQGPPPALLDGGDEDLSEQADQEDEGILISDPADSESDHPSPESEKAVRTATVTVEDLAPEPTPRAGHEPLYSAPDEPEPAVTRSPVTKDDVRSVKLLLPSGQSVRIVYRKKAVIAKARDVAAAELSVLPDKVILTHNETVLDDGQVIDELQIPVSGRIIVTLLD
jgi:hypothetical protein